MEKALCHSGSWDDSKFHISRIIMIQYGTIVNKNYMLPRPMASTGTSDIAKRSMLVSLSQIVEY